MAKLAPIYNDAQFINAIPATGAKLFTYAAGSSTKQATYTDITGTTPQANPIILNSRGEPASPIWLTEGLSYKFVFAPSTDSDPPVSPIRTIDNITGINDTSITIDQWVASGLTPTYVSATSFTLPGDQTSTFQVGRRLKFTVTAGTVYGTISTSVFGALTTVTVVMDAGQVLDSGLSAVSYGLISTMNTSFPYGLANFKGTTTGTAPTYILTPPIAIISYSQMPRITAQFNAGNSNAATTLNISSLGAKSLKQFDGTGAKIDPNIASGQVSDIEYDGTDLILLDTLPQGNGYILNRNCVQYGPVTTTGIPDLIPQSQIGNSAATGVTLKCSTTATLFSAAQGFNSDGTQKNYNRIRTTDLNVPLTINTGNVIWYDPNNDTGGATIVTGSILPVMQYGGSIAVTNNLYTYDYLNHIMYLGNGVTATAVTRVLVALVHVGAANVDGIFTTYNNGITYTNNGNNAYFAAFKNQLVEAGDVRTLSGTAQDWTIPAWARRINISIVGMSTNGTSVPIIQLGDIGGIETNNYLGGVDSGGTIALFTTGFSLSSTNAATRIYHGTATLLLHDNATNTWAMSGILGRSEAAINQYFAGSKALSQSLSSLRITTVAAVDTFDAGTMKVTFEG